MSPGLFKQDAEERGTPSPTRSIPRSDDRPGRRDVSGSSLSVLGPGLEITGDVKARGAVQLEGRVDGTLQVEGQLTISSRGSVEGEVTADEIVVGGRVDGSLVAREVARLRDGCRVVADVRAPRLELEDGGLLQGRVEMKGAGEGARRTSSGGPGRPTSASQTDDRGAKGEAAKKQVEERTSDAA